MNIITIIHAEEELSRLSLINTELIVDGALRDRMVKALSDPGPIYCSYDEEELLIDAGIPQSASNFPMQTHGVLEIWVEESTVDHSLG